MGYGKWIAGGLGWTFGGPIGGLIGFALGSLFEKTKQASFSGNKEETMRGDFAVAFVVLVAAVMKADGKVLKAELNYVKSYMLKFFGEEKTKDMLQILRELLKKDINVYEVTAQVKANMNYASRLQLLHFLFGIAQSDGYIDVSEINIINDIANGIGISSAYQMSIKNMYIADEDATYKILGVSSADDNETIKKAYKKMAIKYHPDKVSYLGTEARLAAEEKFKKINEAYEKIKKARNIK